MENQDVKKSGNEKLSFVLLLLRPLFFIALFIYGSYSFYYEYIRWTNITLVILNALLIAISVAAVAVFAQMVSGKNTVKTRLAAGLGGIAATMAVLFGIGFVLNNVVYHEAENVKAVSFTLAIAIAVFGIALFAFYYRAAKNAKALRAVTAIVVVIAMLAGFVGLIMWNYDWKFLTPVLRMVQGIGGLETEADGLYYSFAHSSDKINSTDALPKLADIDIAMAKNEWENFQIVLGSAKSDVSVCVQMTDFQNAEGDILPVSLYKEHYSTIPMQRIVSSVYPDALIPMENGETVLMEKNYTQAFFIETRTTAETKAGEYMAALTVTDADNNVVLTREIKATVWDFTLPAAHYSDTAMGIFGSGFFELAAELPSNLWGHNGGGYKEMSVSQEEVYKLYYDYLLDHGISAYNLPYDILDERADAYMSDPRVTSFIIPYYEDDAVLAQAYEKISSNPEWARKGCFYPIDEPSTQEHFDSYNTIIERLERLCPGFNMVTPFASLDVPEDADINPFDLQKANNSILCGISSNYTDAAFRDELADLTEAGKRVWWYVCCGPTDSDGFCNMFIYQNGLKHRTLLWQQYDYDVTGLLYWNTAYWDKCGNPWESAETWDSWDSAGDGMWLYPGACIGVDGPVGPMRLINVTAGLEDYDYLCMAEEQFGKEWVDEQVALVTGSLTEYTSESQILETTRRLIGEKLARG